MPTKKPTIATEALKQRELRTFGFVDAPTRSATFLEGLARLGTLPTIVSLPELVGLITRSMDIDQAALRDTLVRAAFETRDIRFWGRPAKGRGVWELDKATFKHMVLGKPHVRPAAAGERWTAKLAQRELVEEAMGVAPVDVARLLRARGVKVPPELMEYLLGPTAEPATDKHDARVGEWWQIEHAIVDIAQSIGERLHAHSKKTGQRVNTGQRAIATEIATRIEGIERAKGTGRLCPSAETVRRAALIGWTFKPE